MRPTVSYLICCAERTGSTLLGDALTGTGIAGRPRSYFNRAAHFNPRINRALGDSRDDDSYLHRVLAAASTPNGVFGAKVHWAHFLNLIARVEGRPQPTEGAGAVSMAERLRGQFPELRYIWLTRKNAVARAISHYRVIKTGRWQIDSRWVTDDSGGEGEPEFDFDQIDAFVRLGEAEDAHWQEYFRKHGIAPLEMVYEELIKDLEGAVRRVLEFLGIPVRDIEVTAPSLQRQADGRSAEWEARYRRLCAEEGN